MITGIDSDAPVVARHSITIDAPLRRVWDLHADVSGWPSWQSDITAASATGPLVPGSVFHWTTFGMEITSTVYAVEEPYRVLWGGPAHGVDGIHEWTFTEEDGVVHVRTEESWDGEPIRADAAGMGAALDASLTAWLDRLKRAAEAA
ncbi:SRPBCC family protein [Bailinhaonella thermotolerans]|uniref:Shy6-polyketide cyclase n=1 Tax=Bailinhaonella thermotolerans TaxID=1070861 RepID=A0A3A4A9F4_9ACTN|nr:SRPBCC family protein [Bailinhaonella thermotolerans]RJL22934.1 Shy6-polyketide cyclase [Bailinhaonella thermotolerans]